MTAASMIAVIVYKSLWWILPTLTAWVVGIIFDKLIGDLHANGYTAENDRIHPGAEKGGAL